MGTDDDVSIEEPPAGGGGKASVDEGGFGVIVAASIDEDGDGQSKTSDVLVVSVPCLPPRSVPEDKIRSRYQRLWEYIAAATAIVDTAYVYDNTSSTHAFRRVATYVNGSLVGEADWPDWTPSELPTI